MIILRQRTFSEKKKEKKPGNDLKILGAAGVGMLGSKHFQDKEAILEELRAYKSAAKYGKRANRLGTASTLLAAGAAGSGLYDAIEKHKRTKDIKENKNN